MFLWGSKSARISLRGPNPLADFVPGGPNPLALGGPNPLALGGPNPLRATTVFEHFLSYPDHTVTDMQLIPIEKIFSSLDSICKAREATLIITAKTIEPNARVYND